MSQYDTDPVRPGGALDTGGPSTEPGTTSIASSLPSDPTLEPVSATGTTPVSSGSGGSSTTDTVKEQGGRVAGEAAEGTKHVAGVAKDEAANVASAAGQQAKDLLSQARSQLTDQASTQQNAAASWLRDIADELGRMTSGDKGTQGTPASGESQTSGTATRLASQAGDRVGGIADWLERHEPADLLEQAQQFARRRPGAFLAVAAVGGLLAGRLTRGLTGHDESSATGSTGSTDGADSATGTTSSVGGYGSTYPEAGYEGTASLGTTGTLGSAAGGTTASATTPEADLYGEPSTSTEVPSTATDDAGIGGDDILVRDVETHTPEPYEVDPR
ncbi:hypothetical protein [Terracoccus luteus]|uniref:F0F1-type ATP synthase membrane subunit b/b n=1 Tax=Terracoccus luteus TaxID=53356 RepID=A0A839PVN2_9MICO|nr:hypothetical protein [Terracoccus luteus]MBB2986794.1 hypothetical protein [Terracoccus luteus]MCP2172445.1 hypothetical protein [Terracoccus luteus]